MLFLYTVKIIQTPSTQPQRTTARRAGALPLLALRGLCPGSSGALVHLSPPAAPGSQAEFCRTFPADMTHLACPVVLAPSRGLGSEGSLMHLANIVSMPLYVTCVYTCANTEHVHMHINI